MDRAGKEKVNRLMERMLSPLHLAGMLILVIIVGNLFNWSDVVYGTQFNKYNPMLVFLAAGLFLLYSYRVRKQCKKDRKG